MSDDGFDELRAMVDAAVGVEDVRELLTVSPGCAGSARGCTATTPCASCRGERVTADPLLVDDVLRFARGLLADPARWNGGERPVGFDGCGITREGTPTTHDDPLAVRWCSLGALGLAAGLRDGAVRDDQRLRCAHAAAHQLLEHAGGDWVGWVNDRVDHAHLLDVFDRARAITAPLVAPAPPRRKALVTMYEGPCRVLRDVTLPALRRYAERHGYEIVEAAPVAGLPAAWSKIPALLAALERFDFAVWVDADALVLDDSEDLVDRVPPAAFQAIAVDPRFGWCTCLWVLRADPRARAFLRSVWDRRHEAFPDWEQGAVAELLGFPGPPGTVGLDDAWGNPLGELPTARLKHTGYQTGTHADRARRLRALALTTGHGGT